MENKEQYCFACQAVKRNYKLPFTPKHVCNVETIDSIPDLLKYIDTLYWENIELKRLWYYPKEEEIRVGGEYWVNMAAAYTDEFDFRVIEDEDQLEDLLEWWDAGGVEIKVMYLSHYDLEQEGWEQYCKGEGWQYYKKNGFGLRWEPDRKFIRLERNDYVRWEGICNTINDLRFKCQDLHII